MVRADRRDQYDLATHRRTANPTKSWLVVSGFFVFGFIAIVVRLWWLQVYRHDDYVSSASNQRDFSSIIPAVRGEIFATERDGQSGRRPVALAVNREAYLVFADTRNLTDAPRVAQELATILQLDPAVISQALSKADDPYIPLAHRVSPQIADAVRSLRSSSIGVLPEKDRYYPNGNIGSHSLGFVSYQNEVTRGQYGVEGYLNKLLAGEVGLLRSEHDPSGAWIALADRQYQPAQNGANVTLTLDWTIQHYACNALNTWVKQHGATGGSVVIVEPKTGNVLALCGSPDFDLNNYSGSEDLGRLNNPATFLNYEPGSIFKPITMAAAIDQGKVAPTSTYVDEGKVVINANTIRNSDGKAHGLQTMIQVLDESLNTGAIYAMRSIGPAMFDKYLRDFGFGSLTGIEQTGEASGDISPLTDPKEIYHATASFGQGITVTPLQMTMAYAALANGGKLMKPHLVASVEYPSGKTVVTEPTTIRQVVSQRTSALIGSMLVSVVRNGHGKRAGVAGYAIGGKTGTAQIPRSDGRGYETGATIGSFAGYGPVDNPAFAMVVRIDRPQDVQFAESSAAPLFGQIAKFILQYMEIPPTTLP